MEDQTIEPKVVEETEVEEVEEETPAPTDDINELKAQLKKYEERGITQRERTRALKAEIEKLKKAVVPKDPPQKEKTGELDDTQLDYLDLKGINEQEDIEIIQKVMQRTGQTVRQVLKDEYVQTKLEANKKQREVSNATPSSVKRGGNQTADLASAIARYEKNGELPDDFALRSQVVNAVVDRANTNKPAWKK